MNLQGVSKEMCSSVVRTTTGREGERNVQSPCFILMKFENCSLFGPPILIVVVVVIPFSSYCKREAHISPKRFGKELLPFSPASFSSFSVLRSETVPNVISLEFVAFFFHRRGGQ